MSSIQTTGFDYAHLDPDTRIVVRQKADELKTLLRAAAQNIFDIGARLADVREQLQHNKEGGFEAWLDAEFGMSRRTAYNFIGVHERFANRANFAQLDIAASALYLLAAPSTPDAAREEALRRAEAGERITHQAAKRIAKEAEPEPTEAQIEVARDLVSRALSWWKRPVNLGSIYNQVQREEGGAGTTRKAVKAALHRMTAAGNAVEQKDAYGRTVYAFGDDIAAPAGDDEPDELSLAHAFSSKLPEMLANGPLTYMQIRDQFVPEPLDTLRVTALRRALDTLLGERRIKKDGGHYLLVDPEPATVIDELNAKFDRAAIIILGRSDDGAMHRAVDVARKLVAAGVWNGTSRIEFDAYAIHDKLFGPQALDPQALTRGKDRDLYISGAVMLPEDSDKRVNALKSLALDELASGPLSLAQIRARLGISVSDQASMAALRAALADLVASKQLRQVRDLYRPPSQPDADTQAVLSALASGPKDIRALDAATRFGLPRIRELVPKMIDAGQIVIDEDNLAALPDGYESNTVCEYLPGAAPFDDTAHYQQYAVPASSVADFLARYYKADRYTGRGEDYAATLLKSYEERFEADGYVIISHHDSKAGEIVAYFGQPALGMDVLLDQTAVKPAPDEQQLPTPTARDAEKVRDLLKQHAPMPLRMKYIREQLDMGDSDFYRARMLLLGGGQVAQDGESLRLVVKPAASPEPPAVLIDATDAMQDEPNSNGMAVHYSSESAEWYTPAAIVERVILALTGIDLDPCSNSQEAPNVPAAMHYTKADDGLAKDWAGKVYMNPPYGREIAQWVDKLVAEHKAGRVTQAIALLPARTDTAWFAALRDFPRCFLQGRLKFLTPQGVETDPAPFPSMLVYLGSEIDRFAEVFADLGDVYVRYAPKEEGGVPV